MNALLICLANVRSRPQRTYHSGLRKRTKTFGDTSGRYAKRYFSLLPFAYACSGSGLDV